MKTEIKNTTEEIQINGSRKVVLGVRGYPELKIKLAKEAESLGITISEHIENILLNKDIIIYENENAKREMQADKNAIRNLNSNIMNLKREIQNETEKFKAETDLLKNKITELNANVELFNNQRLLQLFSELKGRNDTIESPDGKIYSLVYEQPKDLLLAMIYSFKIKEK